MNDDYNLGVKDFLMFAVAAVSGSASRDTWANVEFDGVTMDALLKRSIEIAEAQKPRPKGRRAAIEHTKIKRQKRLEASEGE